MGKREGKGTRKPVYVEVQKRKSGFARQEKRWVGGATPVRQEKRCPRQKGTAVRGRGPGATNHDGQEGSTIAGNVEEEGLHWVLRG